MATKSKENNIADERNSMATEKPRPNHTQWMYIALDHVICLFVTAPMVPSFWRGTWFLYGHYVFPSNPEYHGWTLTGTGILGAIGCYLLQNKLVHWFKSPHPITWFVVYHVFLYLFAVLNVAQWKGLWLLWDHYTGITESSAFISISIATVALVILRCCKTFCDTSPLQITHDTTWEILLTPTRFDQHQSGNPYNFLLDTLLTILFIQNCNVTFWRGTWTALDLLLYPDDFEQSAIVSLGVACCLAVIFYVTQFHIAAICKFVDKQQSTALSLTKQMLLDVVLLVAGVCTVCYWRGVWYLWDVYLWPEDPVKSAWFTHGLGVGVLSVLGVVSSLTVRSFADDDYLTGSPDKLFPVSYITYWKGDNNQVILKNRNDQEEKCARPVINNTRTECGRDNTEELSLKITNL